MFLYVHNAVLAISKAFCRVIATQTLDQVVGIAAYFLREFNDINSFEDDIVCLHGV